MMAKEKKKVPNLRFKGFTDDWEQRKLGDMGNVITGNTPSTKDKSNWTTDKNKGHIWITPTDINRKVLFDSERYLSDKGWLKARKIPKNSVLITSIASIGKNAINGIDAAFNQQINALILQNNNYYFVLSLMDKEKKRFEALAGQTATPIINKSTFSSFQLQIPSENEQNKIGNFFKKIDNLITLHQRKLDLLNQLKKGLLQKMFADKDSKQPILRFKGFHDDWEQRRLGEVAEIKTGSRNHQDSVDNGKYPFFIRSEKVERLNEYDFDTKAILVPGDGRIGEIFHYYDGKFALHQRVYKVDNFKEVNPLYLLNLFKYKFKKHALRLNAQGTVPSLRLPMFTNWNILIPNLNEQQKIGLFFQQLDSLITLQQRKQNHLKLLKKSLLQQMFI